MEFERILLAYDELSNHAALDYTKQDLLFTPDKTLGDITVYTQFMLDLKDYQVNTDDINTDDIIVYKEPETMDPDKLETREYRDVTANPVHEIGKSKIDAEKIILAYNSLNKKTKLEYSINDLLFNQEEYFENFILELNDYKIDINNINSDDILVYEEPIVEAVEKEDELSYPDVTPNPVPEIGKQVYDMSSVILAYNALNKITKLDYSINDILFDSDKEYNNLSIWTDFILRLKEHDIIIDDFNPDDLIEIKPEITTELENELSYPELQSTKTLPDISLENPHQIDHVVKIYNKLDKVANIGYARSDLIFNPNQDYMGKTIWQAFCIDCYKHGLEL
jgi:hypothetical protein